MRTIRRKLSRGHSPNDTQRMCAYCGVVWYKSRLKMDRSGNLYCPDEGNGRDAVTLSEGNAAAAATYRPRIPIHDTGSIDTSSTPTKSSPQSILGEECIGWWASEWRFGEGGIAQWENIVGNLPGKLNANLFQPTPADRPATSDTDIVYTSDQLISPNSKLVPAGNFPAVWVVVSIDTTDNDTPEILQMDQGAAFTTNKLLLSATQSTFDVVAPYSMGGSLNAISLTVPRTVNSTLHLVTMRQEDGELFLKVDGVENSITVAGSTGVHEAFSRIFTGNTSGATRMTGRINAAVVSRSPVTATQISDMETYFTRNFSELSL